MPTLELTELEAKACWLILDGLDHTWLPRELCDAERSLFDKVYRAYRGMPPEKAA